MSVCVEACHGTNVKVDVWRDHGFVLTLYPRLTCCVSQLTLIHFTLEADGVPLRNFSQLIRQMWPHVERFAAKMIDVCVRNFLCQDSAPSNLHHIGCHTFEAAKRMPQNAKTHED